MKGLNKRPDEISTSLISFNYASKVIFRSSIVFLEEKILTWDLINPFMHELISKIALNFDFLFPFSNCCSFRTNNARELDFSPDDRQFYSL